jgi:hypothetical protein
VMKMSREIAATVAETDARGKMSLAKRMGLYGGLTTPFHLAFGSLRRWRTSWQQ